MSPSPGITEVSMPYRKTSMRNNKIEAIYPLSPMQQGMLFHTLYAPESGEYVGQIIYRLEGELDLPAFSQAWQSVVDRHPVLRTAFFGERSDKPLQVVLRHARVPFEEVDWRGNTDQEQRAALQAHLEADRTLGFEISKPPLLRLILIRLAENAYELIWTCHHLVLDGWSVPLVLSEVVAFYEAICRGEDLRLEPVRPYRDYIAWLQKQDLAKAEEFWRAALKGFTTPGPWPFRQSNRNGLETENGFGAEIITLSAQATAELQSVVRQHQLTLNTAVQGAWALLLSRYSGEEEVLFGATVSGRPPELAGVETMIGLFINTLPVRVQIRAKERLLDLLRRLQAQQAEAREYEYSPLMQVQEWSEVPRGTPLFDSLLVFENYPLSAAMRREQTSALKITDVRAVERVNYPITLVAWHSKQLHLRIGYDKRFFDADLIRRMLDHLKVLLEGITADPQQCCSVLRLLTDAERRQLLVGWNHTQTNYPKESCIHQLIEAQAKRTPEAVALTFEDQSLTYHELDRRSNKLAHFLRERGVGSEVLVGVFVERSFEAIVALLGILKAGGAYLPLDQDYPSEGLAFMLDDAGIRLILTQQRLATRLPRHQAETICLDTDWGLVDCQSEQSPVTKVTRENLAYAIYTSGSTGDPKAVMVSHGALLNLALAFAQLKDLGPGDAHMQFVSLSFDASGEEIYPTLISGATLVLHRSPTRLSPLEIIKFCEERGVVILHLPPALWHQLVDEMALGKIRVPSSLRMFVTGGESPDPERLQTWAELTQRRIKFLLAYGLSETTITTTVYETIGAEEAIKLGRLPIGRPINNVQVYVLDKELGLAPIGVPGEIYVAGDGLARGYLNKPDSTAERFVPHPYSQRPGARLYRTGDLARYLNDGNLQFLGRLDLQVKVRGYRIELGHIEAVLLEHPGVFKAVVVAREEVAGERILVAYVVPAQTDLGQRELRRHLAKKLPQHMAPSAFMMLEELPLTSGGKVDRQALPAPLRTQSDREGDFARPRTWIEEIIAGIWGELMKVDSVGLHDDFFYLGGHSLLATQVTSRIRETIGVEVPLRTVFESPTVAELAREVEILLGQPVTAATSITRVARDGQLLLSFAQQRLWFFDQLEPENPVYNIPVAVRLTGPFNAATFSQTLRTIVGRHEVLRTAFALCEGQPMQVIEARTDLQVPLIDLTYLGEAERDAEARRIIAAESVRPFDLSKPPLLRAYIVRYSAAEHAVMMVVHHIVGDGWSMGVLVREVSELYSAFSARREPSLPKLPIQYADYASWQREHLQGEVLEDQLAYWRQQLAGAIPMLELPTDRPRPAAQRFHGSAERFTISQELSHKLKTLSRQQGMTLFMTLLAAYQILLFRYTGQDDVSVGTPVAGRNRVETEGLIGFFLNTLVLRTNLSGNPTFRQLLKRVRETCLAAYAHQDAPFEVLVEKLRPARQLRHMPFFQVMFILHNAARDLLRLPGVTVNLLDISSETAKFDLVLEMVEGREMLSGSLQYNTDLFDASSVKRMVGHFQILLGELAGKPDQPLSKLKITSTLERRELSSAFDDDLEMALEKLSR